MRKEICLLGILIVFLVGNVNALEINTCEMLNTSTLYELTQDIINSSEIICMNITSSDVILDCRGHRIDGVDSTDSYGIKISGNNVTIKNCVVSDFTYGIDASTNDNKLLNNYIYSCSRGMNIVSGYRYNITNNTLYSNTDYGIYFRSDYSNFTGGNVSNNTDYGIRIHLGMYNTISNSTISGNGEGIYVDGSDYNTIEGNRIYSNTNRGIFITWYQPTTSYSEYNIINNNNITYNGNTGIWLYKAKSNTIENINSSKNTNNGIYFESVSNSNQLRNSLFIGNTGSGILLDSSQNNKISGIRAIGNKNGININYADNNNITTSHLINNTDKGIIFSYSNNNYLINSSIVNSGVYAFSSSTITNYLINTTFDFNSVSILGGAIVWLRNYLNIRIMSDSLKISNAQIKINDSKNNTVFSGLTNAEGLISILLLNSFRENSTERIYYYPYRVNVKKDGIEKNVDVDLDVSKFVTIEIEKIQEIISPSFNIYLNISKIIIVSALIITVLSMFFLDVKKEELMYLIIVTFILILVVLHLISSV